MLDRKEEDSPRKFRPPRINFEPKSVPGAEGSSLLCENTSSEKGSGEGKERGKLDELSVRGDFERIREKGPNRR